jgi:hypothetical protein
MFLDDDDSFDVDFMRRVRPLVAASPLDVLLYFDYTKIAENRSGFVPQELKAMKISQANVDPGRILVGNFFPNNSFCIPSHIAARVRFDPHLPSHEDWDFLIGASKLLTFQYMAVAGPNVHIQDDNTRNTTSHATGSVGLDFLSIYRKWPVAEPGVRRARQDQLKIYGLDVPVHFL